LRVWRAGHRLDRQGLSSPVLAERVTGEDLEPSVALAGPEHAGPPGALVVHNPEWRTGMGSSLAAGIAALRPVPPESCTDVVIALADQPLIGADSVRYGG
jgi:CTP:molybdopterin cytidylyltransferase MocA